MKDGILSVVPEYGSIHVSEGGDLFEHLITREFESDVHRGLHKSARESTHITPVFYNCLGWVDFDADYAQKLVDRFGLDVILRRYPTSWKRR